MNAFPRFRLSTLLIFVAICAVAFAYFDNRPARYPNGTKSLGNSTGLQAQLYFTNIASVSGDDMGKLLYGFVPHPDLRVTSTRKHRDSNNMPDIEARGVFWVKNVPYALWVNGDRIRIPENVKIVAIREDGSVRPIKLAEADYKKLSISDGVIKDDDLWNNRIAPALEFNAR